MVIRFANGGEAPGVESCGLGLTMSGVIVAMRRTLLSCTSLARHGLIGLGVTMASIMPARADEFGFAQAISTYLDLNHQEVAALTTSLALLSPSCNASSNMETAGWRCLVSRSAIARR